MPVTAIREFMRGDALISDDELLARLRTAFSTLPTCHRRHGIQEAELSLDGYGGDRKLAAAERVRAVLRRIEKELPV